MLSHILLLLLSIFTCDIVNDCEDDNDECGYDNDDDDNDDDDDEVSQWLNL